jgi:hypothetical protein
VPCPFHPYDPFHRERASSAPCTADPNDPFQYLKEAREKVNKSIEKRLKNYPARRVTIGLEDVREENPSSDAPPHSLPPVHPPESDDSKAQEKFGFDESKLLLSSDSKDTVDDNICWIKRRTPSAE